MGAFVQLRAEHIRVCSHLQAVKPLVLGWRHGARRLVLVDLDDLVLRVGVEERGDADLGDKIAGDLAAVERVLARDDQLPGWRVRLEPARAHNGVIDARGAQVPDGRIGGWQGGVYVRRRSGSHAGWQWTKTCTGARRGAMRAACLTFRPRFSRRERRRRRW